MIQDPQITAHPNEADLNAAHEAIQRGDYTVDWDTVADLPPPPTEEPTVVRGVRLPATLDRKVAAEMARRGVTRSDLIRQALEQTLPGLDVDEEPEIRVRPRDLHRLVDELFHRRNAA